MTIPGMRSLSRLLLAVAFVTTTACNQRLEQPVPVLEATAPDPGPGLFREVTADAGVHATYRNGQEADHYAILESLGGGVGLLDYNRDGLLDVFAPGGGTFEGPDRKQIKGYPCRLFQNLGGWKFRDVTAEAGLADPLFYTHGCAVADYDRDGWTDLLVTGWGRLALYHNEPDGKGGRRFAEVSQKAGLTDTLWSSSAAWGDLDGDGDPDLYVCHYVNWSFANHPRCAGYSGAVAVDVCPPKQFLGLPHVLYRNNGDGTFTDVSKEAGIKQGITGEGKGLGVLIVDVNDDRKPDIYVANDTVDNFLYINRSENGKLRFEELAMPSGVARDDSGVPQGSMGVDAADFDGSGRPAIWVTNYENEMHALYRNQGRGLFLFCTQATGIAAIGQKYVGFGTAFVDVDNKGWEDIVVTNGHVIRHPTTATLRQRPVLLRNLGTGRFVDVTREGGPYFRSEHIGRGLAAGDLDNDGWVDLALAHVNEPLALLRNEARESAGRNRHWLGIELEGEQHRDLVGAKVIVEAGGRKQTRFVKGGGSYLSARDPRQVFGLGAAAQVERVTVVWPSGKEQHWPGTALAVDRYHRLIEGKAQP